MTGIEYVRLQSVIWLVCREYAIGVQENNEFVCAGDESFEMGQHLTELLWISYVLSSLSVKNKL